MTLEALESQNARVSLERVGAELRTRLADWQDALRAHVPQARQLFRKLLVGPLMFTPIIEARRRGYRFEGEVSIGKLLTGLVDTTFVASPSIPSWNQILAFLQQMGQLLELAGSAA